MMKKFIVDAVFPEHRILLPTPFVRETPFIFSFFDGLDHFCFGWKCVLNTFYARRCVDERRAPRIYGVALAHIKIPVVHVCWLPLSMHNSIHNRSTLSLT